MVITPNISICIPMYNASLYIKECINSVLAQSFQDFELLIVDDGSTDSAEGLLRGGFGSVAVGRAIAYDLTLNACKNRECKNGECANPECSNQCTINYCGPTTPTAAPSGSPTPTVKTMYIGF